MTLFRNEGAETNSLLPAETLPATGRIVVPAVSIDDFSGQNGINSIDYVHSDLQGYELQMLRGATRMLERRAIRTILVEICFDPFYRGQSKAEDLWAVLCAHGVIGLSVRRACISTAHPILDRGISSSPRRHRESDCT